MLRPQGQITVTGEDTLLERDTLSCGHCTAIVMVKPGTFATTYYLPNLIGPPTEVPGAMCRVCMRPVCLTCHGEGRCLPFERRIEQMEARGRMLRSAGL